MPHEIGTYLSVSSVSPRLGWNRNVDVRPQITVRFNIPINTALVTNTERLNQHVIFLRKDTEESIRVEYVSWTLDTRTLVFQPNVDLNPGEIYQVTLLKEFQSSEGRHMVADYTWDFMVEGLAITKVALRSPGDSTAYRQAPTLSWDGVTGPTGDIHYQIQLDTDWGFGNTLVWTTTITASGSGGVHSTDIGESLDAETAYYWRVRAYTTSLTGDWSETRSFWLGGSTQAAPDTQLLFEPDLAFSLDELLPEDGTTNLSDWPTIRAFFTQSVSGDSINETNFQLWKMPVDGRPEVDTVQVTGGTFSIVNEIVTLTPAGDIANNTRYLIKLTKDIQGASGDTLPDVVTSYFTGPYSPLYGGTIAVRSELGGFINRISDDEVNFHLWRASLHIHALLYTRVHRVRRNASINDLIGYSPTTVTWGMIRYAELTAAIQLLQTYYYDVGDEAGRREGLATFQYEVSVELLAELQKRLDKLKKERDEIGTEFLLEFTVPRTVIKSQYWYDGCPVPVDDANRQNRYPPTTDWSYLPYRRRRF